MCTAVSDIRDEFLNWNFLDLQALPLGVMRYFDNVFL